jgi:hypothetical protein
MINCPFCQQEIEKDSFFCDQCGKELKVCPNGHGIKKGNFCGECQTRLVEAKNAVADVQTSHSDAATTVHNAQSSSSPVEPKAEAEKTVRPSAPQQKPKNLVSTALNARLEIKDGGIIGRRAGDYVGVFGSQAYVSGTHARLQMNAAGDWEVVDLDSSNGTFLNGVQLSPQKPYTFKVGDTIAFYDIKFIVE